MMYGYGGYNGYGGYGIMMFGMAIFWILIIALAIFFFRRFTGHHNHGQFHSYRGQGFQGPPSYNGDEAMDILRQRFAKGEITPEEFENMKEVLTKK